MEALMTLTTIITGNQTFLGPPTPIPFDEWWGPKDLQEHQNTSIRPDAIHFDEQMIKDLKHRLQNHVQFKPPFNNTGFEYGFNTNSIQYWLTYWAEEYPFKERETFLNQYPQFKTNIQGLDIHFLRVKPKVQPNKEVVPLLILHGWPGSIREFYEVIPLLLADYANEDFAIEIIAPCLPGFGFSDAAVRPGLGAGEIAVVMRNLMHRLGFQKFYLQGGDWGAIIGGFMSTLFPQEILGYHTNWALSISVRALDLLLKGASDPSLIMDPKLANRLYPLSETLATLVKKTGYLHLASTKPDTIGIALTDSPAGLLAYILEKFTTADSQQLEDGGLKNIFTPEQLIDNLMIYWSTRSITTAKRLYAETFNRRYFASDLWSKQSTVPFWALQAKNEFTYEPPSLLKLKWTNLLNTTTLDFGNHFFAMEQPVFFNQSVREALRAFRKFHQDKSG